MEFINETTDKMTNENFILIDYNEKIDIFKFLNSVIKYDLNEYKYNKYFSYFTFFLFFYTFLPFYHFTILHLLYMPQK